ncbi:MAG: hypothetical protein C0468_07350, partial [Planctomyces sp.]|nr:hypothetical protein [Planctomyces sp.]
GLGGDWPEPAGAEIAGAGPGDEGAVPDEERRGEMLMATGQRRRALPVDTDVVEVERRLHRDGGSEYLINGRRARLKDIRDLFMDTGIGADAYSIIEQGKVDGMLLASPTERRVVFEEAAGVAKYRQRRAEAQRKLERTEQNLTRAREQLASADRRLKLVRGQAARARQYRSWEEELRALRMSLGLEQYDELVGRLAGLTSRLSELGGTRAGVHEAVGRAESAKQEAELERHSASDALRQAQAALQEARHARASLESRGQGLRAGLAQAKAQGQAEALELGRVRARVAELETAAGACAGVIAEQEGAQERAEGALRAAGEARRTAQERAAGLRAEAAARRGESASIDRQRAALEAAVAQDARRAEELRERLGGLVERAAGLGQERQRGQERARAAQDELGAARQRARQLEADLAEQEGRVGRLRTDRAELARRVGEAEQAHARADARRASLAEMVQARVGVDQAVRDALDLRQRGVAFAGVLGVLADLVDVDASAAGVVEAALGSALQGLVVPSLALMPAEEELARLTGRVELIACAAIGPAGQSAASGDGEVCVGRGGDGLCGGGGSAEASAAAAGVVWVRPMAAVRRS